MFERARLLRKFVANTLLLGVLVTLYGCPGGSSSSTVAETENGVAVIGGGSSDTSNESAGAVDGNSDASNPSDNNEEQQGDTPTGSDSNQTGVATDLEGVWIKECVLINQNDPDEGYRIWTLTFEGSRFSSYIRNFTTPGCTSASAIYSQVLFQGYFYIGEDLTSNEGLSVRSIDVHTQSPIESVEYDIFYLSNNKLYFGDTNDQHDGLTIDSRPSTVNFYWDLSKDP